MTQYGAFAFATTLPGIRHSLATYGLYRKFHLLQELGNLPKWKIRITLPTEAIIRKFRSDTSTRLSDYVNEILTKLKDQGVDSGSRHQSAKVSSGDSVTHLELPSPYKTADTHNHGKPVEASLPAGAVPKHDMKEPFSIGVAEKDQKNRPDITKSNPSITDKVFNSFSDMPYGYDPAEKYATDAIKQMITKYGPEPVEHLLDTLSSAHRGSDPDAPLKRYQSEFYAKTEPTTVTLLSGPSGGLDEHARTKLNPKLYNLDAALGTPGGIDKISDTATKLKAEGLKGSLTLDQISPEMLRTLSKPEERAAFIQLKDGYVEHSGPYLAFMRANKDHPEFGNFTGTPSETLRAFKAFEERQPKK